MEQHYTRDESDIQQKFLRENIRRRKAAEAILRARLERYLDHPSETNYNALLKRLDLYRLDYSGEIR